MDCDFFHDSDVIKSSFVRVACATAEIPILPTKKQISVRLPVVTRHEDVDERVDASSHINEKVAEDIPCTVSVLHHCLENSDGEVAHHKSSENHQNHPK